MGRKLMILFFLSLSFCFTTVFSSSSDTGTPETQYLQVAEVSERIYQGGPAIAVILSDQLNPEKRYDNFFEVSVNGQKVSRSWVLSDNHRMLYFPEIEPDTEYTVLIFRGLAAIWINPETGKQVNSDCPVGRKILKEIPRWPLVLDPWLSAEIRQKASFPILDPVCGINPAPEPSTIKLAGLSSGITLRRAGALNNAPKVDLSVIGARQRVFWLINSELAQITSPKEVFSYRFGLPGQYKITVLDTHGNFDSVDIRVLD